MCPKLDALVSILILLHTFTGEFEILFHSYRFWKTKFADFVTSHEVVVVKQILTFIQKCQQSINSLDLLVLG